MFSLILRFIEPGSGEILLHGQSYSSMTHQQGCTHLAYVEEETAFVPGTIRENLLFIHPNATEEEIWEVLLEKKANSLGDGLDTLFTTSGVSGGQRQRIPLARTMVRTPDILLLDAANAQVDGITELAIQRCIRDRSKRSAVLIIAHRLSAVIDADDIIVMDEEQVGAQGSHEECWLPMRCIGSWSKLSESPNASRSVLVRCNDEDGP